MENITQVYTVSNQLQQLQDLLAAERLRVKEAVIAERDRLTQRHEKILAERLAAQTRRHEKILSERLAAQARRHKQQLDTEVLRLSQLGRAESGDVPVSTQNMLREQKTALRCAGATDERHKIAHTLHGAEWEFLASAVMCSTPPPTREQYEESTQTAVRQELLHDFESRVCGLCQ